MSKQPSNHPWKKGPNDNIHSKKNYDAGFKGFRENPKSKRKMAFQRQQQSDETAIG